MIEVIWSGCMMTSSALLCVTNNIEKQTLLCMVALKTQSRTILKTFKNNECPTAVFQAADSTLFIGTEGGKIECWSLETNAITTTINAHEDSTQGIS
jgi:hypothetical protein